MVKNNGQNIGKKQWSKHWKTLVKNNGQNIRKTLVKTLEKTMVKTLVKIRATSIVHPQNFVRFHQMLNLYDI